MLNRKSTPKKLTTERPRHPLRKIGIRMELDDEGTYFKRMKLIEPYYGMNFIIEICAKYISTNTGNVSINKEEYNKVKLMNMPVLLMYSDLDSSIPNMYLFLDNANIVFVDYGVPFGLISINQFKDISFLESEIKERIKKGNVERSLKDI